jgi:hypothetical protein
MKEYCYLLLVRVCNDEAVSLLSLSPKAKGAIMKFVHDRCELTVNVTSSLCNLEVFRVRYGWDMAAH